MDFFLIHNTFAIYNMGKYFFLSVHLSHPLKKDSFKGLLDYL